MVLPSFASITGGTWIISPHSDDAALSVGIAIVDGVFPRPINVVTVFTVSAFSSVSSIDPKEITQLRNGEDRSFAAWYDVTLHSLAFQDAPLRASHSDGHSVFDASDSVSWSLVFDVAASIRVLNDEWNASLLVLPRGIGHHIDHRTVAETKALLPSAQTVHYSDQPYSIESGEDSPNHVPSLWSASASAQNVGIKRTAIAHYASQPAVTRFASMLADVDSSSCLESLWL